MHAVIRDMAYYLPETVLSNEDLAGEFPDWPPEKVLAKTGIERRHLAGHGVFASDLAVAAAQKLFAKNSAYLEQVDFLLLCTQSPDYLLPTTACLVQQRLGLPTHIGALDINLGCSGYVYGLMMAKSLIEAAQAKSVLLVTCDTYSKFMDAGDFNVRALFGDGASATIVESTETAPKAEQQWIGPFVHGTDGSGAKNLILERGGSRAVQAGQQNRAAALFMNGPEIFSFTLAAVPRAVGRLLELAHVRGEEIDHFVFHQANQFMLEHLRKKLGIPAEKFIYALRECGNTTSSSIPIALCQGAEVQRFRSGQQIMLVGFGVGYSWSAGLIRWNGQ